MKLVKYLIAVLLLVGTSLYAQQGPVIDKKFVFVNAVSVGSTFLDIHYTQRCIAENRCYEANPFIPQNRAGMYGVQIGLDIAETVVSYELKKHGHNWWIVPVVGIGYHVAGISTALRF